MHEAGSSKASCDGGWRAYRFDSGYGAGVPDQVQNASLLVSQWDIKERLRCRRLLGKVAALFRAWKRKECSRLRTAGSGSCSVKTKIRTWLGIRSAVWRLSGGWVAAASRHRGRRSLARNWKFQCQMREPKTDIWTYGPPKFTATALPDLHFKHLPQ